MARKSKIQADEEDMKEPTVKQIIAAQEEIEKLQELNIDPDEEIINEDIE